MGADGAGSDREDTSGCDTRTALVGIPGSRPVLAAYAVGEVLAAPDKTESAYGACTRTDGRAAEACSYRETKVMKPVRCIFEEHDYGDWIEKDYHMVSVCKRCGYTRAKYKDPGIALAELMIDSVFRLMKEERRGR